MSDELDRVQDNLHDALLHLYDYAYLESHPLAEAIMRDPLPVGRERMRYVRRALLEAIEALRPDSQVPLRAGRARLYHLLNLRYVEKLNVVEITKELSISERQVYRDLRRAEEELCHLLVAQPHADPTPATPEISPEELFRQEMARASSRRERVGVDTLMARAKSSVEPLAEQRRIEVAYELAQPDMTLLVDRQMVRQALVRTLSYAVQTAEPGSRIGVAVTQEDERSTIQIRFRSQLLLTESPQFPLGAAEILSALGATCAARREGQEEGLLEMVLTARTSSLVLVIDDNPALIELFERYLAETVFRVVGATDGLQGQSLAESVHPDVIVIDVMMPVQDGWEVLQRLRNQESTRETPIIICSVMNDPELAYSLGAAGFLAKPVTQAALFAALARVFAALPAPGRPTPPESAPGPHGA